MKTDKQPEYPEHDKLFAVSKESQAIGAFLDASGYRLAKVHDHEAAVEAGDEDEDDDCAYGEYGLEPVTKSITDILAKHFGIDLKRLEQEKRAMLEDLRKQAAQPERSEG